jgi:hypothetical protein
MTLPQTSILMTKNQWIMRRLLPKVKPSNSGEETETETETGKGNVIGTMMLLESIAIAIVRAISMPIFVIHTRVSTTNLARISLLLLMDRSDVYIRFPEVL